MSVHRFSRAAITVFVILWTFVFHYESVRYFYLNRMVGRSLPKFPLLFPPAGWIMFYKVGDNYGYAQVYGIKDGLPYWIDPHLILTPRFVGFDNIHRNVLSGFLSEGMRPAVCRYLARKFPTFDTFAVTSVYYPSVTSTPYRRFQQMIYTCGAEDKAEKGR